MAHAAARDLDIDLARSWMIGDKWADVQFGHQVGARSILVRTGWGRLEEEARPDGQRVDLICDSLADAVSHVLHTDGGARVG
jgi:histidinol phosphatase-like enzyme